VLHHPYRFITTPLATRWKGRTLSSLYKLTSQANKKGAIIAQFCSAIFVMSAFRLIQPAPLERDDHDGANARPLKKRRRNTDQACQACRQAKGKVAKPVVNESSFTGTHANQKWCL
jgi:hypothetical protein